MHDRRGNRKKEKKSFCGLSYYKILSIKVAQGNRRKSDPLDEQIISKVHHCYVISPAKRLKYINRGNERSGCDITGNGLMA